MKFLLGAGLSAFVTFVFISVALFTQGWVTAYTADKQSAGILLWGCVSDFCDSFWLYADDWALTAFIAMLFAWIIQFFVLVSVITALVLERLRYPLSKLFTIQELIVTILLLYVLIAYGATYDKNIEALNVFGVRVYVSYLDYSYWLCIFGTIFSLASLILGGIAIRNEDRYDTH